MRAKILKRADSLYNSASLPPLPLPRKPQATIHKSPNIHCSIAEVQVQPTIPSKHSPVSLNITWPSIPKCSHQRTEIQKEATVLWIDLNLLASTDERSVGVSPAALGSNNCTIRFLAFHCLLELQVSTFMVSSHSRLYPLVFNCL